MGQITENSTFDPTVYQWETTDSVTGGPDGIAVLPIKNLTNRTRYLSDRLAALQQQVALLAPINSPVFTGSPQAPTPALSAKSNEVATAGLARAFASGLIQISMTSTYQLSTIEAGNASIILVGSPQGPGLLLLPTNAIGRWTIFNSTTVPVTVRLSQGGQSVTIAANGYGQTIIANANDCFRAHNDYTDANLQGSPSTQAPALDDNSSRVPNTSWVNSRIAQEGSTRLLADQQIRSDVASGYATQSALAAEIAARSNGDGNEAQTRSDADNRETAQRIAADTQIRVDVEGTYLRKGQVQGGNAHGNFTPGDYFDVPVAVNLTTGATGGIVYVTSSLCLSYQIPNAVTLDVYVGAAHSNAETTFTTISVQTAQPVPANTTITISAHARTGGGGGWCQMALGLGFIFVPNA